MPHRFRRGLGRAVARAALSALTALTSAAFPGAAFSGAAVPGTESTTASPPIQASRAAPNTAAEVSPFVVEYYYRIKWGYGREFWQLFNRNHYPVLLKQQEQGRILQIKAEAPFYHATEADRWDFRVTVVWRNPTVAHDDYDGADILPVLFPDQARFRQEEQRRFELMLAHWDVIVTPAKLAVPR